MVRALGVMIFAGALFGVSSAHAQTLGEAAAATGIHQTLAGTGAGNPAGTINTVKKAVGNAAATKQNQLNGANGAPIMGAVGWGGKGGGRSGWTVAGGAWGKGGNGTKGWATASAGWAGGGKSGPGGAWAPSGAWAGGATRVN